MRNSANTIGTSAKDAVNQVKKRVLDIEVPTPLVYSTGGGPNMHMVEWEKQRLGDMIQRMVEGEVTKDTGKLNSTKDIYKVSPKDIYQALEGYEQTHKFKAHFRGFEAKAQRSLSHMSDKQLIYSFK